MFSLGSAMTAGVDVSSCSLLRGLWVLLRSLTFGVSVSCVLEISRCEFKMDPEQSELLRRKRRHNQAEDEYDADATARDARTEQTLPPFGIFPPTRQRTLSCLTEQETRLAVDANNVTKLSRPMFQAETYLCCYCSFVRAEIQSLRHNETVC